MAGHDRITAEGKRFFEQIEELKKLQVRVGYQDGQPVLPNDYEDANIVDIAVLNEVGTSTIPARPFMRQSVDNNKAAIEKICGEQLKEVVRGGTAEQALEKIGAVQAGFISDTISKSKSWAEPNAESTIARKKGGDVPLADTGRLMQSPHFVIVPKDEDE